MKKQFSYLDLLPLYDVYYKKHSLEKYFEFLTFLCQNNQDILKLIEKFSVNFNDNIERYKELDEIDFAKKMKALSHIIFDSNNKANYDWAFNELRECLRRHLHDLMPELDVLNNMKLYDAFLKTNMEIADDFLDEHSSFEIEPINFEVIEMVHAKVGRLVG